MTDRQILNMLERVIKHINYELFKYTFLKEYDVDGMQQENLNELVQICRECGLSE